MPQKKDNKEKEILDNLDFKEKNIHNKNINKKNNLNKLNDLENKLKKEQVKSDELLNELKRAKADFINLQNRIDKKITDVKSETINSFITSFILVLDDINSAKDAKEIKPNTPFESICNKIESILNNYEVKKIGKIGDIFDPNIYEAITVQNSNDGDAENKQIVQTIVQYGYQYKNIVIRPARVIIGAKIKINS